MTGSDPTLLSRRTVLRSLAGPTAAGALGTGTAGASRGRYHVVQGDRCLPVEPLSGERPVEELYDLHIPDLYGGDNGATDTAFPWYGSLGTQSLQRENTTITFLYDGPGGLSLVVVHGEVGETDGEGGRGVSWTLTGATLADGDWVVKDDFYRRRGTDEPAATNYDRWDIDGTTHTIDWTWGDARTDGGAFRSLGDDFAVTIDPAYNEAAALWDATYYDGRVTDWEVLSFAGGDGSPERYSLALDEAVVVRSGPCAVEVSLDVRSRVNPDAAGVVPVVLSGPHGFDVRRIDTGSLRVGAPSVVDEGGGGSPRHAGHVGDVDGDGRAELVVHVPTDETGFTADTTAAKIVGRTTDGRRLLGTGPVRLAESTERDDGDPRDDGEREDRDRDDESGDETEDRGNEDERGDTETDEERDETADRDNGRTDDDEDGAEDGREPDGKETEDDDEEKERENRGKEKETEDGGSPDEDDDEAAGNEGREREEDEAENDRGDADDRRSETGGRSGNGKRGRGRGNDGGRGRGRGGE